MQIDIDEKKRLKQGNFDFINGEFSPDEAYQLLESLFSKKINFHELKSFSHQIRNGESDKDSLSRSQELRGCKKSIEELTEYARLHNKTMQIQSTISIKLI
jgi:DNA-binding NtrC family response regulator